MSRDRDRILEQALKHELRAAGTPPAGAPALRSFSEGGCLDAETLGAWTEGGLSPAAMAAAEAHVSSCARCQALVATMTKSAPALDTEGTPGTLGTLSLWKWWLAPIAAGVTAATLWMVVPEQQQVAVAPPQSSDKVAVQPPAAAESVAPPTQASGANRDQVGRRTDQQLAAAATEARMRAIAESELKEEKARVEANERSTLADAAVPAAPAAPPAPAPAAEATAIGALQKSARGVAPLPPGEDITDQAAPSPLVSWYVGRAGLVMLTTDGGKTFTRVNLPEPLDLATVTATDAKSATVMTTAGRRFQTNDGGRTWRPI